MIKITKKRKHGHREKVHCIIKRRTGKCEGYQEKKVYASVYAACYVTLMHGEKCEKIANSVAKKMTKLVHKRNEMPSSEIAKHVIKELKKYSRPAAFMYETHRDVS